ncbi:hypothetical protein HGA91_02200 [candidate division WWE3 bacterium]|nr:hypothetical protein [candidate division WWE3 bacterium]
MKKILLLITILGGITFLLFWLRFSLLNVGRGLVSQFSVSVLREEFSTFFDKSRSSVESLQKQVASLPEQLSNESTDKDKQIRGQVILKIGIISDSHGHKENIQLALTRMVEEKVDLVFHLGDFTAGGESEYFADAKNLLEKSGIPYYVLPGDHDFNWFPERSRSNYELFFGQSYNRIFSINGIDLILYDNSTVEVNSPDSDAWLSQSLELIASDGTALFFSPKPLYNPYFESKNDPSGHTIIEKLVSYGVRYSFAGDTHIFARYLDPTEKLNMVTVGAVGEYKNPLPQWVLLSITDLGEIMIDPRPIVKL